MAAASAWEIHNTAKLKMFRGEVDFDTNAYTVRLYTSSSDIDDVTISDATAENGNELTTANGYTALGTAVVMTTSESSGIVTIDSADATWNATSSGITARFAALIDTTLTPDEVVAHCLLDAAPADVTAPNGNVFRVQIHANGVFLAT
jgi:hypothetical protein